MQGDWKKNLKEKTGYFPRNNTSHKIGDVFRLKMHPEDGLHLKNGADSRNKFIIITGFTPEGTIIGTVLINSKNGFPESEQYPLTKDKYAFLSHTSYVDCSSLFELDNTRLSSECFKGTINNDDLQLILKTIAKSQDITPKQKKKFGFM